MRAALLSWLPLAAGCSLLFDFTVEQCKYDVDCEDGYAGELQLRCEQGLCVARPDCKANSDCPLGPMGEVQICAASKCQSLQQDTCDQRFPSSGAIRDGAIVLGAFSPNRRT